MIRNRRSSRSRSPTGTEVNPPNIPLRNDGGESISSVTPGRTDDSAAPSLTSSSSASETKSSRTKVECDVSDTESVKSTKTNSSSSAEDIGCDCCDQLILKNAKRYRCEQCEDFDLCEKCFTKWRKGLWKHRASNQHTFCLCGDPTQRGLMNELQLIRKNTPGDIPKSQGGSAVSKKKNTLPTAVQNKQPSSLESTKTKGMGTNLISQGRSSSLKIPNKELSNSAPAMATKVPTKVQSKVGTKVQSKVQSKVGTKVVTKVPPNKVISKVLNKAIGVEKGKSTPNTIQTKTNDPKKSQKKSSSKVSVKGSSTKVPTIVSQKKNPEVKKPSIKNSSSSSSSSILKCAPKSKPLIGNIRTITGKVKTKTGNAKKTIGNTKRTTTGKGATVTTIHPVTNAKTVQLASSEQRNSSIDWSKRKRTRVRRMEARTKTYPVPSNKLQMYPVAGEYYSIEINRFFKKQQQQSQGSKTSTSEKSPAGKTLSGFTKDLDIEKERRISYMLERGFWKKKEPKPEKGRNSKENEKVATNGNQNQNQNGSSSDPKEKEKVGEKDKSSEPPPCPPTRPEQGPGRWVLRQRRPLTSRSAQKGGSNSSKRAPGGEKLRFKKAKRIIERRQRVISTCDRVILVATPPPQGNNPKDENVGGPASLLICPLCGKSKIKGEKGMRVHLRNYCPHISDYRVREQRLQDVKNAANAKLLAKKKTASGTVLPLSNSGSNTSNTSLLAPPIVKLKVPKDECNFCEGSQMDKVLKWTLQEAARTKREQWRVVLDTYLDAVHSNYCVKCGKSGTLICCDSCSASYHLECLGMSKVPKYRWNCTQCETERRVAPNVTQRSRTGKPNPSEPLEPWPKVPENLSTSEIEKKLFTDHAVEEHGNKYEWNDLTQLLNDTNNQNNNNTTNNNGKTTDIHEEKSLKETNNYVWEWVPEKKKGSTRKTTNSTKNPTSSPSTSSNKTTGQATKRKIPNKKKKKKKKKSAAQTQEELDLLTFLTLSQLHEEGLGSPTTSIEDDLLSNASTTSSSSSCSTSLSSTLSLLSKHSRDVEKKKVPPVKKELSAAERKANKVVDRAIQKYQMRIARENARKLKKAQREQERKQKRDKERKEKAQAREKLRAASKFDREMHRERDKQQRLLKLKEDRERKNKERKRKRDQDR
eukprot:g1.t1